MAIQAMGNENITVADEVNILKRPGFEAIPITLDSTAFRDGVCKAGAPIVSESCFTTCHRQDRRGQS